MLSAPMVLIHQFVLNLETLIQFAIVVSDLSSLSYGHLENTSTLKIYFKTTTFRSENFQKWNGSVAEGWWVLSAFREDLNQILFFD